tara:strand:- start:455 stop:1357 length:903 start_codon:yes stop_codon:yes gene_type:complete
VKKILFAVFVCQIFLVTCRTPDDDNGNSSSTNIFEANTGSFEFTSHDPLSEKPFKVHFYIPNSVDRSNSPILFVFPGMNRDASNYLTTWIPLAELKHIMVFSFEFSDYHYPGGNAYQQGYVFDDNGNLNGQEKWAFSAIEPVFDFIKNELNYQYNQYDMFGHSGGAQFVHRYVIFKPNARINRAIAANSGWYTLPDTTVTFPYGLESTGLSINEVQSAFTQQLQIHLGQNDNNPNDPSLRDTPEANLQGAHRLDRGRYFIAKCDTLSNQYSSSFNWLKKEVPNVGHNREGMSVFAANELY